MQFPQHASSVVTNHNGSYNPEAPKVDRWGFMLSLVDVLQSGVIHCAVNVYFHRDHLIPLVWPRKMRCAIMTALIGTRSNVCSDVTQPVDMCCVNKQAVILPNVNWLKICTSKETIKHRQCEKLDPVLYLIEVQFLFIETFIRSVWRVKVQLKENMGDFICLVQLNRKLLSYYFSFE